MPRESPNGGITQQVDPAAITQLARELDELSDIERELSLAQRWVQGRISGVLNSLAEITEDDSYVDAEILAAVARGTTRTSEISSEVDVPLPVVEECLVRLADRGIVTQNGDEWRLE